MLILNQSFEYIYIILYVLKLPYVLSQMSFKGEISLR